MSEQRVLVVSPSWVGDMVMSQTLYSLLKSRNPEVIIDVMAPSASKPLVSRMSDIHQSVLFDVDHGDVMLGYRYGFAKSMRDNRYDRAIVLPNSMKSALVPFFANIPQRTGYRGEMRYFLLNDMRRLDRKKHPRLIDRFMVLGLDAKDKVLPEYVSPRLTIDPENQLECVRQFELDTSVPVLGLCPGAEFGDAKRWPARHFAKLLDAAVSMDMQVWLFGSARDRKITREIIELSAASSREKCHNLAGRTTLLDAIDLLGLCQRVVTNDSGLMHIAAAVGCRMLVIYGSTSPDFTPPLSDCAEIIKTDIHCSPCFQRECPLGHKNCLNQLLPEKVIAMLESG